MFKYLFLLPCLIIISCGKIFDERKVDNLKGSVKTVMTETYDVSIEDGALYVNKRKSVKTDSFSKNGKKAKIYYSNGKNRLTGIDEYTYIDNSKRIIKYTSYDGSADSRTTEYELFFDKDVYLVEEKKIDYSPPKTNFDSNVVFDSEIFFDFRRVIYEYDAQKNMSSLTRINSSGGTAKLVFERNTDGFPSIAYFYLNNQLFITTYYKYGALDKDGNWLYRIELNYLSGNKFINGQKVIQTLTYY